VGSDSPFPTDPENLIVGPPTDNGVGTVLLQGPTYIASVSDRGAVDWVKYPSCGAVDLDSVHLLTGDLNGDGRDEIIAYSRGHLHCLRANGSRLWSRTDFTRVSGITVERLNGAPRDSLFITHTSGLEILDGSGRTVFYREGVAGSVELDDADGDGFPELLYCESGTIHCFSLPAAVRARVLSIGR
ncbi:MAG: hypothetical protein KDC38_01995, partial [Planctomycetes bacterium]|nr:hypothetical protein [Planctomycetota bacterium]